MACVPAVINISWDVMRAAAMIEGEDVAVLLLA